MQYHCPNDSLWNFESVDDVVANEIGYSSSGSSSEGYRLEPLDVILRHSQNPYVPFGPGVYRANEVEVPGVAWLMCGQVSKLDYGSMDLISVELASSAFSGKGGSISFHGGQWYPRCRTCR